MSVPSPAWFKARRRLGGVAFLVAAALLVWLSVALYDKLFSQVAMVTLYTDSVGNEMHPGAQVMVRGVGVGEVRQISADGRGARLELAIQPGALSHIPANVTAQMLPTTLFGERYVDLVVPASPSAHTLANGGVIRQNRSADAIELERVLNNLLPLLTDTQPDKLSVVLTAIAQGLQGRGGTLGRTLVTLSAYLRQFNPQLPALDTDIARLAGLASTYRQATPAILHALNDFAVTGRTLVNDQAGFTALLTTLTTASQDLRAFLAANSQNAIQLSTGSTPTLRILARYAPEFPCVLHGLVSFEPNINKVLGQGSKHPGLHVNVLVVPSLGRYIPGRDTPVYGDNLGPHCYPIPFPGIHLNDGATSPVSGGRPARAAGVSSAAAGTAAHPARAGPGRTQLSSASQRLALGTGSQRLGWGAGAAAPGFLAGSPQESELVKELAALSLGRPPSSLPAWSDLLLGPVFRGAKVSLG